MKDTAGTSARGSPRLRLRVDLAPGCSVGPGKISLLEAIERQGSLSVAARSIDMSYRRAWNLLDDLNQSFAEPVVSTAVGGTQGGGAQLTAYGRQLVKAFRALEIATQPLVRAHLRKFSITATSRKAAAECRPVSPRPRASR